MEFRVFLILDWLPNQNLRTQSADLFTHCWRENNWIHFFFRKAFELYKMQTSSSRIWTRITRSISYDDNHLTTGTQDITLDNNTIN